MSETVDHEGGWDTYIALDSQDLPHIAYRDTLGFSGTALKYAHWDGAAWQIDTVEGLISSISSRNTTLALDNDDLPHISYSVSDSGDAPDYLYHAYQAVRGGAWLSETVEVAGYIGDNALALDTAGDPHMLYLLENKTLKYARRAGTAWYTEPVVEGGEPGRYSTMVLD